MDKRLEQMYNRCKLTNIKAEVLADELLAVYDDNPYTRIYYINSNNEIAHRDNLKEPMFLENVYGNKLFAAKQALVGEDVSSHMVMDNQCNTVVESFHYFFTVNNLIIFETANLFKLYLDIRDTSLKQVMPKLGVVGTLGVVSALQLRNRSRFTHNVTGLNMRHSLRRDDIRCFTELRVDIEKALEQQQVWFRDNSETADKCKMLQGLSKVLEIYHTKLLNQISGIGGANDTRYTAQLVEGEDGFELFFAIKDKVVPQISSDVTPYEIDFGPYSISEDGEFRDIGIYE